MIELTIDADGGGRLAFEPKAVVIAGYTGRDRAAVQHHIDELAAQGIAPPPETPAFYRMPVDALTTAGAIDVPSAHTSGEVEPVLIAHRGRWYMGVGSDHTDRQLEREDIGRAKAACPKPLGTRVWRYEDVHGHADAIAMHASVSAGGADRMPYQDGSLAAVMPLDRLIALMRERTGLAADDLVMFCGTVPLLTGAFAFAARFEGTLVDSVRGAVLDLAYAVRVASRAAVEPA